MAYAFSRLKDSLGNDTGQTQKTNIFSADGTDSGMTPAVGMQQQQQQPKTSTEGEISSGGGGGGAPTGETIKTDMGADAQGTRQSLQKAAGKTQNPALLGRTQNSLTSADQALQNEANSYVDTAKQKSYAVKDEDIDKYVAGDQPGTAITDLLSKTAADKAEGFKTKQNLDFYDVDQLQSDPGIKQALRNEGGNEYSAGMGAYDLAALKRTPGFDQIRASLAAQKSALQNKEKDYETSKTTEAQSAYDANLKAAQEAAKTGLGSRAEGIKASTAAAAAKANADRKAGLGDFLKGQAQTAAADEAAGIAGVNPSSHLAPYLTSDGIDASKYYTDHDVSDADMMDANKAAQFNRIMMALGRGPESNAVAGKGLRDQASDFDKGGFQKAVNDAASGKWKARESDLRKQIDRTQETINARRDPLREQMNEIAAVNSELSPQYQDVWGGEADAGDMEQFQTGVGRDWHNYVNQGDVDALNPIYQELGEVNPYAAGSLGAKGSFDQDAYKDAMIRAMTDKRQSLADQKAAEKAAAAAKDQHQTMNDIGAEDKNGRPTTRTGDALPGIGDFIDRAPVAAGIPAPHVNWQAPALPIIPTKDSVTNDFNKLSSALKKKRFY